MFFFFLFSNKYKGQAIVTIIKTYSSSNICNIGFIQKENNIIKNYSSIIIKTNINNEKINAPFII